MATTLLFTPQQAMASGVFAPAAKAYFYQTGTTTPVTVYSDDEYTTPHPSPLEADAAGVFPQVFYDGSAAVKVVITTAADATIVTVDPVARVSTSNSAAGTIAFSPIAGNSAVNVQSAIATNTNRHEDRSSTVKLLLSAADASEARTSIGLGTAAVVNVLDEDSMASGSPTNVPSQQSTKAYVDTQVAGAVAGLANALRVAASATVINASTGGSISYGGAVSKVGTGHYRLTFTTAQPDTNYVFLATCAGNNRTIGEITKTTSYVDWHTEVAGSGTDSDQLSDVLVFRLPS